MAQNKDNVWEGKKCNNVRANSCLLTKYDFTSRGERRERRDTGK